jgi:hypothetical protein
MQQNSLPPTGPQQDGHSSSTDSNSSDQSKENTNNKLPPLDHNKILKSRWGFYVLWGAIGAIGDTACFAMADFFWNHGWNKTGDFCMFLVLAITVAVICKSILRKYEKPWIIWPCGLALCVVWAVVMLIVILSSETKPPPAPKKPHLSAGLRLLDWHLDMWLTNDFLIFTHRISTNGIRPFLTPADGHLIVPVQAGESNFSLSMFVANNSTKDDPMLTVDDVKVIIGLPSEVYFIRSSGWFPLMPVDRKNSDPFTFVTIVKYPLLPGDSELVPSIVFNPKTCLEQAIPIHLLLRSRNAEPEYLAFWLIFRTNETKPYLTLEK